METVDKSLKTLIDFLDEQVEYFYPIYLITVSLKLNADRVIELVEYSNKNKIENIMLFELVNNLRYLALARRYYKEKDKELHFKC